MVIARKKRSKTKTNGKKTFIAMVLDRSASMFECLDATISGYNEQIGVIKKNARKGGQTKVSLTLFGGPGGMEGVTHVFENEPADKLEPLTDKTYKPEGITPMYDGVGSALSRLEQHDDKGKDTAFLVIIVSDGLENASRTYTSEKIRDLVDRFQKTGRWTFLYIGANQDLADIEKHLGFKHTFSYVSTPQGTQNMYRGIATTTSGYLNQRSQ